MKINNKDDLVPANKTAGVGAKFLKRILARVRQKVFKGRYDKTEDMRKG